MSPSDRRLDSIALGWAMRSLLESRAAAGPALDRVGKSVKVRPDGSGFTGLIVRAALPDRLRDPSGGVRGSAIIVPPAAGRSKSRPGPRRPRILPGMTATTGKGDRGSGPEGWWASKLSGGGR